jgi:hypothetical protein
MAKLRICIPDPTTNYIKNPQIYDTTGWVSSGATISKSYDRSRFGVSSLKIVTDGIDLNEGAYFRVNALQGVSEQITVSIYARGSGSVRIRFIDNPTGMEWKSRSVTLSDNMWTRIEATGRSTGSNDVRLYVESDKDLPQSITFYADGAQMERKSYSTTYCDGEQPGCQWSGIFSNSKSSRSAYTREGGKWLDLNSHDDLYYTVIGGLGSAPIRANTQSYGDSPGSYYQNYKVLDRVLTILFHVKKNDLSPHQNKISLSHLHELRQSLFETIKPDRTAGSQEFIMEYQDGDYPIYFYARYDAGLEGDWDVRNQWVNSFPVRFVIVSPFLFTDSYESGSLYFRDRITVNYSMMRIDGQWLPMNGGMNGQIYQYEIGPRGQIYAVGAFTRSNYDTDAIDPEIYTNFVSFWDGEQWQQLGSGANGIINSIAISPDGKVYVTGEFTSIGGVSANRVAYWDGSAWNAMSTGFSSGAGFAIAVSSNGDVYAGGSFVSAGGTDAYYCARWDGISWSNIGLEKGLNNFVYAVSITSDGSQVYFGGDFTDEFGSPGTTVMNYVGLYEPENNQFYALADGFNNTVRRIKVALSGRVYACGDFTGTGAVISDVILYIGYWNGAAWFSLGIGADDIIRDMDINNLGHVIAVGDFENIGSVTSRFSAFWNGSTWVNNDVDLEDETHAVKLDRYGNIYLSPGGTLADIAGISVVNNVGTAEVHPIVFIVGPCTLKWLENQTSKKTVYANLEILENEEITIDFGKGTITSSIRGDMSYAVFPGSDIRSWTLIPGENRISMLMSNDIDAVARIYHQPRFWSGDNTSPVEEL